MKESIRSKNKVYKIAVIDGPNMTNLGTRNKRVYGKINSISDLQNYITNFGEKLGVEVDTFVSNFEGEILEYIHKTADSVDGYLINPAGLTTYGEAVRHALEETYKPTIEIHFSNIHAGPTSPRGLPGGPWESKFTRTSTGLFMGMRHYSYSCALLGMVLSLDDEDFLGSE